MCVYVSVSGASLRMKNNLIFIEMRVFRLIIIYMQISIDTPYGRFVLEATVLCARVCGMCYTSGTTFNGVAIL